MPAKVFDDRQGIENKMRLNLTEHHVNLKPVALALLTQIHFRAVMDGQQIQHKRADRGGNGDIINV